MESISSAGVMELRMHVSVSVIMSGFWLSVRLSNAVTCSRMSMEPILTVLMRFEGRIGHGLGWISHRGV